MAAERAFVRLEPVHGVKATRLMKSIADWNLAAGEYDAADRQYAKRVTMYYSLVGGWVNC